MIQFFAVEAPGREPQNVVQRQDTIVSIGSLTKKNCDWGIDGIPSL
jgi:hypothetical protein